MKHKILFFQNCSHIFFPKELILSNQLKKKNWQKFSPYRITSKKNSRSIEECFNTTPKTPKAYTIWRSPLENESSDTGSTETGTIKSHDTCKYGFNPVM